MYMIISHLQVVKWVYRTKLISYSSDYQAYLLASDVDVIIVECICRV